MQLIAALLNLYIWVIIIRALISWVSPDPANPIVQALHRVTEPMLKPLRKLVPPHALGGVDLSPILAIILIQVVKYFLVGATIGFRPFG